MNFFIFLQENFNKPVLVYLNSLTNIKIISDIVYIFADAPIFLIPLILLLLWILNRKNPDIKNKVLFLFYSTVIAILISITIQHFVFMQRPETALNGASEMILKHIPDASFPSDHASVSFAFLTSLALFGFYRIFLICLPLFFIMNLSRVIGGVHWPLDVIAGSLVGIISGTIIYFSKDFIVFKKINELILKIAKIFKL